MHFNVDRIAVLAGLGRSESSGLMREAVDAKSITPPAKPGAAPVAPTGSKPAPTATTAASKPATPPVDASKKPVKEYDMMSAGFDDEFGTAGGMDYDEMAMYEESDESESYESSYVDDDSMVYEVDEEAIMEALVDMRQTRLNESRVRSTVRSEIEDILNEMESGSRWLYGDRKPAKAGGGVTRGFLGPGFR